MPHPLEAFCRAHEAWLFELIETLVAIESPPMTRPRWTLQHRTAGAGGRGSALQTRVETRPDAGDHTNIEIGAGRPRVLLVGHVDTVWPLGELARMPLERRDGRLHGPGVLDMKAGVAMGLLAARAVFETLRRRARLGGMLCTSDEETGSRTSRGADRNRGAASDAVLVLEPALAGGALKTSRKGSASIDLAITGVAAHAGVDPEKGSAPSRACTSDSGSSALHDLERGMSVNVGVVGGGTRPNVVAAKALRASTCVRRRWPMPAGSMRRSALLPPCGARGGHRRVQPAADGAHRRRGRALRTAQAALPNSARHAEGSTGGGSDGNFSAALGIPTLDGLGAIGGCPRDPRAHRGRQAFRSGRRCWRCCWPGCCRRPGRCHGADRLMSGRASALPGRGGPEGPPTAHAPALASADEPHRHLPRRRGRRRVGASTSAARRRLPMPYLALSRPTIRCTSSA